MTSSSYRDIVGQVDHISLSVLRKLMRVLMDSLMEAHELKIDQTSPLIDDCIHCTPLYFHC